MLKIQKKPKNYSTNTADYQIAEFVLPKQQRTDAAVEQRLDALEQILKQQ